MTEFESWDEEPGVGPQSGLLTEAEIVREARGVELPAGTPTYTYGRGADGHSYRYTVVGVREDGSLKTSSWDAQHEDDCPCSDPERWY